MWEGEHQAAFTQFNQALVCVPVLSLLNPEDLFILDTDASVVAFDAGLLQMQDGEDKIIAYENLSLTSSQRKYCTTFKDLLTIIKIVRECHHYLLEKQFIVYTGHSR